MSPSDTIVYRYLPEKNPHEAFLPGVPLRDLTIADVARHPEHVRTSIAACTFYEAVPSDRVEARAAVAEARGRLPRPTETKDDETI